MDHQDCTHSFSQRARRACEVAQDPAVLRQELDKVRSRPDRFATEVEQEEEARHDRALRLGIVGTAEAHGYRVRETSDLTVEINEETYSLDEAAEHIGLGTRRQKMELVYPAGDFGDIDMYQWSRQGQGQEAR